MVKRVANCRFDSAEYGVGGSARKLAELSLLQLPQRQTRLAEPLLPERSRVSWGGEMGKTIIKIPDRRTNLFTETYF